VHVITMAGIVRDAFDKRLNLMRILRPDGTDKALACKKKCDTLILRDRLIDIVFPAAPSEALPSWSVGDVAFEMLGSGQVANPTTRDRRT
jgi:hypothetical protein